MQGKPVLTDLDIEQAKNELTRDSTVKLIGQVTHLCYWRVFGHLAKLPLDKYHQREIFVGITKI